MLLTVVHAESAEAFCGQLMSVAADDVYDMEEAMQQRYGSGGSRLTPAAAGAFCVAKSAINDTFYRAKVGTRSGIVLDRVCCFVCFS